MYRNREEESTQKVSIWTAICCCLLAFLLVAGIFVGIWFFTDIDIFMREKDDIFSTETCTTQPCLELADSILKSIDQDVDPCVDFYQYACGGWIDTYEWQLVELDSIDPWMKLLPNYLKQVFLDSLFYSDDIHFRQYSAVNKSAIFYQTCLNSESSQEEIEESPLMEEFIRAINFTNRNDVSNWDEESSLKFQSALAWSGGRGWNSLFTLSVKEPGIATLTQDLDWLNDFTQELITSLNSTLLPLYKSIFGLSSEESSTLFNEVINFMKAVKNITTTNASFYDPTVKELYANQTSDLSLFGTSGVLNYTNIMKEQFGANSVSDIVRVHYYTPDVEFFQNLITLIENTFPLVVQYYLFSDMLLNALNFEKSLQQSRSQSRADYCYDKILEGFPYVFGFVIYNRLYADEKYEHIRDMVDVIIENGAKYVIDNAVWMDSTSRDSSDEKLEDLGKYIGFPEPVKNGDTINEYYSGVEVDNLNYMENLNNLLNFAASQQQLLFAGENVNITGSWPKTFSDPSQFTSWLTRINAFYNVALNYLVVPVTITQIPFYMYEAPSSINFGAVGGIISHELFHGFDLHGSKYDAYGNYVEESIWTDSTNQQYLERTQCFIDQYDDFEIETGVFVNGTMTQIENIADDGGLAASFVAWQHWRETVTDLKLPGIDLTDEQLFFIGWARSWCVATVPGYYLDWKDNHSPQKARVWGPLQNSKDFADAFKCADNTFMNPSDKCELW